MREILFTVSVLFWLFGVITFLISVGAGLWRTAQKERKRKMKIKGFDKDLKCRGFEFEVGKTYETGADDSEIELCSETVFHYCDSLAKVHRFYSAHPEENNRFCEIEVLGATVSDDEKCGSNAIKIVREIEGEELDIMRGLINGNTGVFNTGNYNTGDYNTGNYNTGDCNTGDGNTGYRNTGDCNTGDRNTGNYNTGDCNTGTFNICNFSSGFFCTEEPKARVFDMDTDMTVSEFYNSKYYLLIARKPFFLTEWITYTEQEKKSDADKELIGGYLKRYRFEEACRNWWNRYSLDEKKMFLEIPNFSAEKFKKITGIDITEDLKDE